MRIVLEPRTDSPLRCAYCHVHAAGDAMQSCPRCGVLIHFDCRPFVRRVCLTLGCAPARPRIVIDRDGFARPRSWLAACVLFLLLLVGGCLFLPALDGELVHEHHGWLEPAPRPPTAAEQAVLETLISVADVGLEFHQTWSESRSGVQEAALRAAALQTLGEAYRRAGRVIARVQEVEGVSVEGFPELRERLWTPLSQLEFAAWRAACTAPNAGLNLASTRLGPVRLGFDSPIGREGIDLGGGGTRRERAVELLGKAALTTECEQHQYSAQGYMLHYTPSNLFEVVVHLTADPEETMRPFAGQVWGLVGADTSFAEVCRRFGPPTEVDADQEEITRTLRYQRQGFTVELHFRQGTLWTVGIRRTPA